MSDDEQLASRPLTGHNEEVGYSRDGRDPRPDLGLLTDPAQGLWPWILFSAGAPSAGEGRTW